MRCLTHPFDQQQETLFLDADLYSYKPFLPDCTSLAEVSDES